MFGSIYRKIVAWAHKMVTQNGFASEPIVV